MGGVLGVTVRVRIEVTVRDWRSESSVSLTTTLSTYIVHGRLPDFRIEISPRLIFQPLTQPLPRSQQDGTVVSSFLSDGGSVSLSKCMHACCLAGLRSRPGVVESGGPLPRGSRVPDRARGRRSLIFPPLQSRLHQGAERVAVERHRAGLPTRSPFR